MQPAQVPIDLEEAEIPLGRVLDGPVCLDEAAEAMAIDSARGSPISASSMSSADRRPCRSRSSRRRASISSFENLRCRSRMIPWAV